MKMIERYFTTSDLYSAVVLKTLGFMLLNVNGEGRRKTFVFDRNSSKLKPEELLQQYFNGYLEVNAKEFVHSINDIKTRLRQGL